MTFDMMTADVKHTALPSILTHLMFKMPRVGMRVFWK